MLETVVAVLSITICWTDGRASTFLRKRTNYSSLLTNGKTDEVVDNIWEHIVKIVH